MFCPKCNLDIPDGTMVCPNCKTAINQPGTPESQTSKNSALKLVFIVILTLAFIVILAIFAFQKVQTMQLRSKVSRVKAEMKTIATALESYFIDACVYPSPGRPSFREPGSYQGDGSFAEDGGLVPLTITTPVAYIFCFLIGCLASVKSLLSGSPLHFGFRKNSDLLFMLWFFMPLAMVAYPSRKWI